jgi:hypothetical protein
MEGTSKFDQTLDWLESHSRWIQLRSLGESSLVRASVLMPAFGYILLLNDNVHQYLTIKYDGILLRYLPELWRVWLLFYGSFCLAIATVIYALFCPREIKRYSSEFEMADAEATHIIHLGEIPVLRKKLGELAQAMSPWENGIIKLRFPSARLADPSITNIKPDILAPSLLIQLWSLRNIKHPMLRILTVLLFGIGTLLLAIPAALTFLQVTALPLGRLLW